MRNLHCTPQFSHFIAPKRLAFNEIHPEGQATESKESNLDHQAEAFSKKLELNDPKAQKEFLRALKDYMAVDPDAERVLGPHVDQFEAVQKVDEQRAHQVAEGVAKAFYSLVTLTGKKAPTTLNSFVSRIQTRLQARRGVEAEAKAKKEVALKKEPVPEKPYAPKQNEKVEKKKEPDIIGELQSGQIAMDQALGLHGYADSTEAVRNEVVDVSTFTQAPEEKSQAKNSKGNGGGQNQGSSQSVKTT